MNTPVGLSIELNVAYFNGGSTAAMAQALKDGVLWRLAPPSPSNTAWFTSFPSTPRGIEFSNNTVGQCYWRWDQPTKDNMPEQRFRLSIFTTQTDVVFSVIRQAIAALDSGKWRSGFYDDSGQLMGGMGIRLH